ncbi:MAG: PD-(D/E)XK nuclease family protein [Bryobacteraceae bacterium]|jgi:ATP-dependent helicase/DNAse subunit B
MRLLTGPPGSGKTHIVLERVRVALRAGDESLCLLAPTATLAQHLQNRLAREGLVFRGGLIQTLSGFIDPWAAGLTQAPDATVYLMVEAAARRVNRPEFARVAHLPGFCAALARGIQEFSAAGCDSARLASHLPDAPLVPAFLAVYREVERDLDRRGLALRAARLERAAEKIEREGAGPFQTILLDGFHALPEPELRLIAALDKCAEVTLTLADDDLGGPVRALAEQAFWERATRARPAPAMRLFRAPSIEREVEEIARRILEQAAAGRPFREMGIIVRAADVYAPVLRSTLGRFGIPARFYFDSNLDRHPTVRFLTGAVAAMLGGWDHARTLAALRLAPRFADSIVMDRFDFNVREQMPDKGLGGLKAFLVDADGQPFSSGAGRLLRKIDRLGAIEEWRSFELSPRDWAARMRALRGLYRPARPVDGAGHEWALEWRSQAAALDAFDDALGEAAEALEAGRQLTLDEFWSAVEPALRLKPLRLADGRRNVVHVMSAHEARQWDLPAVFVCGMTEKQFPQFHRQDPFFPDAARCKLNEHGIRVRTAEEFEREERALFDSAITRATEQVTLSYAEFDARGDPHLPSLFLEGLGLAPEPARPVRPRVGPPGHAPAPVPATIRAPALIEALREKHAHFSPTALERYMQCPFLYFGERTLRLATAPPRPEERLDFMMQGNIVHQTLAGWYARPQDIAPLFESVFQQALDEERIPRSYGAERLRNAMREDLEAFAADQRWPRGRFQAEMEKAFSFDLDGVTIAGKIDRLDVEPDGRAYVIDYKYSAGQRVRQRVRDQTVLQPPLYVMAAEKAFGLRPAGMFYIALKGGVDYAGWSDAPVGELRGETIPEDWQERAAARTLRAAAEILSGRIEARPADPGGCASCDYRTVCRIGEASALPAPAHAGEGA